MMCLVFVLPLLRPEIMVPDRGAFPEVWARIQDSAEGQDVDVTDVVENRRSADLTLQGMPSWVGSVFPSSSRRSRPSQPLTCTGVGWGLKERRCYIQVGEAPCTMAIRVVAFGASPDAQIHNLRATARKGC